MSNISQIHDKYLARLQAATDDKDLDRFMIANRELRLERIEHALWDTAMRIAHGDEGVARARYIQLRVQQMKSEAETVDAAR